MLKWFADRLAETGKEARKDERGFTLIELLVVVIIIGILAAIAIPTFLNQQEGAEEASVESDARNAATAIQSWGAEQDGSYQGLTLSEVEDDIEFSSDNAFSEDPAPTSSNNGFTFSVDNGDGEFEVDWNSESGGLQ